MRRKISSAGLLLAWLCANGALLDVVQVFAWTRMFAGYAESMTVGGALAATFDPARRCALCLRVARTKERQEQQAPVETLRGREQNLVLACETAVELVFSPVDREWPDHRASMPAAWREPTPVPPPRV